MGSNGMVDASFSPARNIRWAYREVQGDEANGGIGGRPMYKTSSSSQLYPSQFFSITKSIQLFICEIPSPGHLAEFLHIEFEQTSRPPF